MTPTPRTDEQWQSITATSPWDAAAEQMMQHACELERELAELTEDVGKCHDVLGEDRASDTSELWKFFETHKQISHRLRCREDELAELTKWREMIEGEVGTLREELAAITCEEGELWELRQENARMRDNLASLSKLHADEMTKAQKSFKFQLAAEREQLAANREATKLMGKWLEDERELADRLAGTLNFIEEECDWKAGGDYWHGSFGDDRIGPACDETLATWKEARRGTV